MDQCYTAYGLGLVADGEIPGLPRGVPGAGCDIRIRLNSVPAGLMGGEQDAWYQGSHLRILRTVPEGDFHFLYADGTEFLVRADGREIRCCWPEQATVADAAVYLRGPILGLVLRLHGVVSLHASVIAAGDCAVAIVGGCGAGKSTTAAGFVELGFPLLADDVAALWPGAGRFEVAPGYPGLNLWPDAAEALYGSARTLPRVTPAAGINHWWDKRYLALEVDRQFQQDHLPLAAVYVLGERAFDEDAPRIVPLSPQDAFMRLTGKTYVNYALDESMRALEFETLARMVRTIPVRLITPHSDPGRLASLCQAILGDYHRAAAAKLPMPHPQPAPHV